jgi:hypothetical protein
MGGSVRNATFLPPPIARDRKMANTENLKTLHEHEEKLRAESLAIVEKSETLQEHFRVVHEAMNVVYGFTHDHPHRSDDELALQMLGIRLFNASAASVKLALSGYYQIAFAQLRDIVETYFLLDHFRTNKDKIAIWKVADKRQLKKEFGPFAIRDALDKRDGFTEKKRGEVYERLSTYASHATYRGLSLTTKENMGEIGPFVTEKHLTAWLEEMTKLLGHGVVVFASHFGDVHPNLEAVKKQYLDMMKAWQAKYFSKPTK